MLSRIHAVVIEDIPFINKSFVSALKKQNLPESQIYSALNYPSAAQILNTLAKDTPLFVLLDRELGGGKNESGVELYFQIINKFSNAWIVSISADPTLFQENILAESHLEHRQHRCIFDDSITEKKTSQLPDCWNKYLTCQAEEKNNNPTTRARSNTTTSITASSSLYPYNSKDRTDTARSKINQENETNSAYEELIPVHHPSRCCTIS